ncbi:ABC transporter substrate-binding protein [Silanimonas sp.]|uniref:ABC transporter substrate-binding protein n=1 Tax=Silanimonas sp. TaxID=1929290 RepID=UPI0031F31A07
MRTAVATQGKAGWRAIALMAAFLCACGTADAPSAPTPMRLGMDLWAGYFPAVIAEREGLMAAQGVDLEVVATRDTNGLIAEFAAGHYDLIAVSLGDAIILSRNRPDVVVLLVADESSGGDQLLRAPTAGADPAAPPRFGTNLGGFGELFIRAWLEREGIAPGDVVWANVDASDVPAALAEGRIDFGHTWQPYAGQAVAAGATPVFSSADTPGLILDVVLATRAGMERHPEAYRGFVRAWFEAEHRWRADSAAGNAAAAAALGLDAATVSLAGVKLYSLDDNRHAMAGGADSPLASLIERYATFFIERGSLSKPPDPAAMFDPAVLPEAATAP